MTHKLTRLFIFLPLLSSALLLISGCISEGAAFGLGAGSLHETVMTEKDKNAPPPVYGPPQIIYRIDDNRYFTLENYTRCENGQTFYNNKKKGVHVKVLNGSGYLFKGRLFWLSTRDDYLAFPATINTRFAACMGSDKGCMNAVIVTVDGGKTLNGVEYSNYTQDPTGDTEDYDMLVTNEGFYMIEFNGKERFAESAATWKWTFDPDPESTEKFGYPGATGPKFQRDLPMNDISNVSQVRMQCNRNLEPEEPLRK
ncbi:hypothetical protein [Pseudescherichia sp.]|uniref:T6SS immunity protein Tli3 family protein n=1 Tax=Pseudescherichia sp. TaxID=2055881 RepID=UPI0028A66A06|nr:hypothetical protein [Pseudescherichia sp.]